MLTALICLVALAVVAISGFVTSKVMEDLL